MLNNKKIIGAFLGTIVEYYDYSLYGFSAAILAAKFFPNTQLLTSLTYIFAIYAVSYLAKPLGSIFFSRLGDKYGRRISLKITVIGISIPTLTIGVLPTYATIGELGAYILILCRFFQGFFVAGEYDGAAIYVIEHLGNKYRYSASALTRATGVAGLLLGIAATNFFNSSIFPAWGWRIPFLLSLPLAILTIYYRRYLEETPDFVKSIASRASFPQVKSFLRKNWQLLIYIALLAGSFGASYQITIILTKQYLPIVIAQTKPIMTSFSILIVLAFGLTMPISGFLADKFGQMRIIKVSLSLTIIAGIVLIIAIKFYLVNLALLACLLMAISVAPPNALAHGVITKLFSANERYRGVSFGHAIGSMLFSGSANYLCLQAIKNYDLKLFPVFYVIFLTIIIFLVISYLNRRIDAKSR